MKSQIITVEEANNLIIDHIMAKLTKNKARKILKHGEVRGHKLTKKQRSLFGARASGKPVRKGGVGK